MSYRQDIIVDEIMHDREVAELGDYEVVAASIAKELMREMGFGPIIQRAAVEYTLEKWGEIYE